MKLKINIIVNVKTIYNTNVYDCDVKDYKKQNTKILYIVSFTTDKVF